MSFLNLCTLYNLVMERAAAEEFPQQGVRRDKRRGYGREVAEKFAQTMGFCILRKVAGHGTEHHVGLVAHHAQLKQKRRVEHRIGIFLIRENPLLLATAHALPAAYSL